MVYRVECAWCAAVIQLGDNGTDAVSHGICPACAAKEMNCLEEEMAASPTKKTNRERWLARLRLLVNESLATNLTSLRSPEIQALSLALTADALCDLADLVRDVAGEEWPR